MSPPLRGLTEEANPDAPHTGRKPGLGAGLGLGAGSSNGRGHRAPTPTDKPRTARIKLGTVKITNGSVSETQRSQLKLALRLAQERLRQCWHRAKPQTEAISDKSTYQLVIEEGVLTRIRIRAPAGKRRKRTRQCTKIALRAGSFPNSIKQAEVQFSVLVKR